jgi:hypothetical protein
MSSKSTSNERSVMKRFIAAAGWATGVWARDHNFVAPAP